jgi:hypothetical protein
MKMLKFWLCPGYCLDCSFLITSHSNLCGRFSTNPVKKLEIKNLQRKGGFSVALSAA